MTTSLICTGEGSLKAKNTRRDPRVALSIIDFRDPYKDARFVAEWSSAVLTVISGTWILSRTSTQESRFRFAAPKEEWHS
jgi:hypothetical protein